MRLIDADALSEELSTLTTMVTGLRAGKGVLFEFMKEYRNSVLRVVDEQSTIDPSTLRPKGEWISVEDRLPEENARVWVFCGGNTEVMIYRRDANGDCRFYWEDELGLLSAWYKSKVTHWMHLPELPDMRGDT